MTFSATGSSESLSCAYDVRLRWKTFSQQEISWSKQRIGLRNKAPKHLWKEWLSSTPSTSWIVGVAALWSLIWNIAVTVCDRFCDEEEHDSSWFNDQQFHYQSTCWYCWNARAYSFAPLARLINCFHHEAMDEHGRKYAGRNASSIQFFPAPATWSEETHPRVSIPGRKLWFAGSLARNASPLDKKMRATWDARVIWHAIKSTPLQCCCVEKHWKTLVPMTLCDTINTDRWRASQIRPALIARKLQIPTAAGNTTQIQQVATHTLPLKRTFAKTAAVLYQHNYWRVRFKLTYLSNPFKQASQNLFKQQVSQGQDCCALP